ncbi:MAG: hypothetical protein AAF512_12855, partial [Pseudomonadota bacterium]
MSKSDAKLPVFLLLQGPLSSFYSEIAEALIERNITVHKVNICGNDYADWYHGDAINYSDTLAHWPEFVEKIVRELGITNILMHGDRRPYHKPVVAWAH